MAEKQTYIERQLESKIRRFMHTKEIIAIVGPRQCGKTTLMKHIFKDLQKAIFIDFSDREKLALFDNDIKLFVDTYVEGYDYLFIDEFQYSKEGGQKLKYIFDTFKIKIFISGSSVSELSIQSIKYLVGRIFVFTLYPLSFLEFLKFKNEILYTAYNSRTNFSEILIKEINKIYHEFVIYGGYPRVALAETKEGKEVVLNNIYNTYLLKEIKEILGFKDDYKLAKIIQTLALRLGKIVNYQELSNVNNINYHELMQNLNVLNKTFIIGFCRPFFTNKRLEISKNPKIYFLDNGFRNYVIKNFQPSAQRMDKEELNENFAYTEFLKHEIEAKYWRTKSKAEVDFITEINGNLFSFEIKSDLKNAKVNRAIYGLSEKYPIKESFILSESLNENVKNQFGTFKFRPLFLISKLI